MAHHHASGSDRVCRPRASQESVRKSIYLHDVRLDLPDKVVEGETGSVIQGVISRATFRWQTLSGQRTFTVLCLHINNSFAMKRGIGRKLLLSFRAVMVAEHVDLVAGDFNGAAKRKTTSSTSFSIIEEAFADCDLPRPPGHSPLWGPGASKHSVLGWHETCSKERI